ncbi:MAG: TQO small subunit DoxA domain-containing protein [Phycisphaerae bacterium]
MPGTGFSRCPEFEQHKIHIGKYGITVPVGSKATITLPPATSDLKLPMGTYTLKLNSVNGSVWTIPLATLTSPGYPDGPRAA